MGGISLVIVLLLIWHCDANTVLEFIRHYWISLCIHAVFCNVMLYVAVGLKKKRRKYVEVDAL